MAQAAKGAAAAAAGAGAEGKSSVAHLPHDAKERWTVVYPAYINKKLKESEGRKIGLNDAVENPTVQEIADICSYLKLPHVIEPTKCYPREFMNPGRVRVQIKDGKGAPLCQQAASRKALWRFMGKNIPNLKTRQSSLQGKKK